MDTAENRSHKAWSLIFWATTLASTVPLFATRYLPFTDTPEHTAAMATVARLLPGGGGAPYEIAFGKSQYLLFHTVGAIVTRLVGDAVLANTALLVLVAAMWPVSMRALLRAFERDERLAIFAGMVFWNRATATGLEPYVASVPLLLFCIAAFVRQLREPAAARAALLVALTLALFYTHASSFLLFAVIASALAASSWRRSWRGGDHAAQKAALRRSLGATALLGPSTVAALVWTRGGGLKTTGPGVIERMPIVDSVVAIPLWTFDVWRSHVDEVCAALWWIAYGAIVVASWRERPPESEREEWQAWLPFVCAFAVYLTIPARIGDAGMLNVRLAPILTLFALLGLRIERPNSVRFALGVAVLATAVNAGNAVFEVRQVERETAGDFDAVLAAMRPGTRLALLNFTTASPRTHEWPYPFAGAYHLARGGAVASFSFAELPHWSVQYAPHKAPPAHAPFWAFNPCEYRFREDGQFYDYVLVQGEVGPFEAGAAVGPPFESVARSARFTLYEKVRSARSAPFETVPDIGPCALKAPR